MAAPFDFACREHLDFSRYFHTRADLDAHLRAEHTAVGQAQMVAERCAIASPESYACAKREGHYGHHQDGCGNRWGQGIYGCATCSENFLSEDALAEHAKTQHAGSNRRAVLEAAIASIAPLLPSTTRIKEPTEVCGYPYPDGAFCARPTGHADDSAHSEAARPKQAIVSRPVPEPQRDPPEFCAACHLRAPEEIGPLAGRRLVGLRPKRDGWMFAMFPFTEDPTRVCEHKLLCPKCGEKVAKFIAHLSTPMLHEEDLL